MSDTVFSPERLQEAMAGMSNTDLAEKLGCAKSSITMYLTGQRTPTKMAIQLMAICLGVSPAWLMGFDTPKYIEKPTPVTESGLDKSEESMLKLFRLVPPESRDMVLQMIEAALKSQGLL